MDNQMNFGSGSPLLGGPSPLQQVMAQSGAGQSAINQVTPNAATFDPNTQPPLPPTTVPQNAPTSPAMGPETAGAPVDTSESQLIIKALSERLKQLGKMGQ